MLSAGLRPWGILMTSRDHPAGDFSRASIKWYYSALEELNRFLLERRFSGSVPGVFSISELGEESRIRLQRQLFLSVFTEEWAFARMAACAYSSARRWDLTVANPRFRNRRLRSAARKNAWCSFRRVARGLFRACAQGPSRKAQESRPQVVWGGISPIEMEKDPKRLSLPLFLQETAGHLGIEEKEVWLVGYGPLNSDPFEPTPPLPVAPLRSMIPLLGEAARALLSVWIHSKTVPALLAVAESPLVSWARLWIRSWRPACVVGTIGEIAHDSPFVVAARLEGRRACLVSYASLNIPNVHGPVWDDLEPGYRYSLYSDYLVWGESLVRLFTRYVSFDARTVATGPVMFAPSVADNGSDEPTGKLRVGIFDISPHSEQLLASLGAGRGWITLKDVTDFYTEIFDALKELGPDRVVALIKPKRSLTHPQVAQGYAQFLNRLCREAPFQVELLDSRENPWSVFSRLDVAISMPFTSMTSVGAALGVPAIYYAPCSDVEPGRHTLDGDRLVKGPRALREWLQGVASKGPSAHRNYSGARQMAKALAESASLLPGRKAEAAPVTMGMA